MATAKVHIILLCDLFALFLFFNKEHQSISINKSVKVLCVKYEYIAHVCAFIIALAFLFDSKSCAQILVEERFSLRVSIRFQ